MAEKSGEDVQKEDGYQINNENLTLAICSEIGCKPSQVISHGDTT